MSLILAIDQSTSATKVMLFDESGTIVDKTSREHRQIYPQPGWVEHDPEEIWQNLLIATAELCARFEGRLSDICSVSIANQRETFVVFDRETSKPLHNAIVWQCRRGDPICQQLTYDGHGEMVKEKTGLKLDTYFPASKIAWLLGEQPELNAKIRSGEAFVSTIDAYLIHRLTGEQVFATDHTNASRTLLYNIHELKWDEELCDLFDVPKHALPEVRNCNSKYGDTDIAGLLPTAVPICGVMGDSQASLFAQRCFQPGTGKATFGTGTSVLINIGHQASAKCEGSILALAWVLDGKPTYALEGIINYSSATIAWLRDQLGMLTNAAESETLARDVEDNGGVYLVPAFAGLSAPHWNAAARAAIVGMSGHTQKAHIVRAALEAISYQIRDVLDMFSTEAEVFPQAMYADGGPTQNSFLMQFTADMTQLDWTVAEVTESSALGAALAGGLGMGIYGSLDCLNALPRLERRFEPEMSKQDAQIFYDQWKDAVQRVL